MRIGLSTSVIQRGRSGVGQTVLALVRALQAETAKHEFTLFVLEEDQPLFDFARSTMRLVPVPERYRPPLKDILWHQTMLPRLATEIGLDVLHVPSYRRMLWRRPCRIVATIHDLAPFRVPDKYDFARMFYGRTVVRRLAHRQDHIIAVSQMTADDIRRFFRVPSERITVVHNGLDHARFNDAVQRERATALARRHGVNGPFFLYVSRLEHPAKNHVRLLAAFEQFKERTGSPWHLVLLGSDWHGSTVIHEAARRSRFAAAIHCPGFAAADELPLWYHAAEVAVYPSLFEGFGLPPLEAMACGCPVIASSIPAIAEVCGSAAALVEPTDVAALADALTRVAGDAARRALLRRAGLRQVRQFDWRNTADRTMRVYARVVGLADNTAGAEQSAIAPAAAL